MVRLNEVDDRIEAASARRPWTVIAWSGGIGLVVGIVLGYLFF